MSREGHPAARVSIDQLVRVYADVNIKARLFVAEGCMCRWYDSEAPPYKDSFICMHAES